MLICNLDSHIPDKCNCQEEKHKQIIGTEKESTGYTEGIKQYFEGRWKEGSQREKMTK